MKQITYRIRITIPILAFFLLCKSMPVLNAGSKTAIDASLLKSMEQVIIKEPMGIGQPANNRNAWDSIAQTPIGKSILSKAQEIIQKPYPQWNDSVYKAYYETGSRIAGDKMMNDRATLLSALVISECIEYQGKYIPQIEHVIADLCKQPTWCLAAHDWYLDNYKGKYGVDLHAAGLANQIGQTLFLLSDRLNPKVQKLALQTLETRVFRPLSTPEGMKNGQHWWLNANNNWNAVCLGGVTACVMAAGKDKKTRVQFAALATQQIKNYINGFMNDGYCVEGLGYFSYGFEYFLLLRESLYINSAGAIDLFENAKVQKIIDFPLKSEIMNGIYPSIADCRVNTRPSEWILAYCRKNLWKEKASNMVLEIPQVNLTSCLMILFGNTPYEKGMAAPQPVQKIRSFFPDLGILTCRPFADNASQKNQLGIAIMGGCNGYSHNHNDVGSYTIVVDNKTLMGDMGGPNAYTSKTFTKERYSLYKSFSSVGHPVPLVNHSEQIESINAKGVVEEIDLKDTLDYIRYDLTSAYACKELEKLERSMAYNRQEGNICVKDSFQATTPIHFETAITTRAVITQIDEQTIYLSDTDKRLKVSIQASCPYTIRQTTISDYGMIPFYRIGIQFTQPVACASVTLTYQSMPMSDREVWTHTLYKIAYPVLHNLSHNTLKQNMPVEQRGHTHPEYKFYGDRTKYAYVEALSRTICGIAPWLELPADSTPEGIMREQLLNMAIQSIEIAMDSTQPDFISFDVGYQALVEAAQFAQGLMRAPTRLWGQLSPHTQQEIIRQMKLTRKVRPNQSNWLMFSAMVETFLCFANEDYDQMRVDYPVRQHEKWYKGDGIYGDGEYFHWDYYNSFVIQPMLLDVMSVMGKYYAGMPEKVQKRAVRYAEVLERLISPEGTFPPIGRSLQYRTAALQVLSQIALQKQLPITISEGLVRSAMTAVIKNMFGNPANFDNYGWLKIGFNGSQPGIGEAYTCTGSLYLCTTGFLALGLPATDSFWTSPAEAWTSQKAWNGADFPQDHAIWP